MSITKPGPKPAQYIEDREMTETLERGERESRLQEREKRPQD